MRSGPPAAARPAPLYLSMRENGSRPVTSPAYCTKVGTICPPTPTAGRWRLRGSEHAVGRVALVEDHLAGRVLQTWPCAASHSSCSSASPASTSTRRSSVASGLLTASPRPRSTSPSLRRARASARSDGRSDGSACGMPVGEESQQPTWPHVMHRRRCTQAAPMRRQSSQPCALGRTALDAPRGRSVAVGRHQADRRWPVSMSLRNLGLIGLGLRGIRCRQRRVAAVTDRLLVRSISAGSIS